MKSITILLLGIFAALIPATLNAQCDGTWTDGITLNYLCADGPFLKFETGDCPAEAQSTFTFTDPVESIKLTFSAFGSSGDPAESRMGVFLNGQKINLNLACKIVLGCQTPIGAYSINNGCLVDSVAGADFGISGYIYLLASNFGLASISSIGVAVSEPSSTGTIFQLDSCNETFGCTTAIKNYTQDGKSIFPNPFTDNITVNYTGNETAEIIIYDITSKVILRKIFEKSININTENFGTGIYIYAVKANGKLTETGKIVKAE